MKNKISTILTIVLIPIIGFLYLYYTNNKDKCFDKKQNL